MATSDRQSVKPTPEEIARRAYELFEERGRPEGRDLEHWLEAETQLCSMSCADGGELEERVRVATSRDGGRSKPRAKK